MSKVDYKLPWPVFHGQSCVVATHWAPDVDGLACASAWLHLARDMQPNTHVALFAPTAIPERLQWIVDGITTVGASALSDFDRCLVLDCEPESERTQLPQDWLDEKEREGHVWCVDHHSDFIETQSPALACSFIDQGLHHPLYFASIWSDTRRLAFDQREAIRYISKLFSAGLDNIEISRQQKLLEPRRPEVLFRDIVERTEVILSRKIEGIGTALVVASSSPWRHEDTIHEVREWLLHYADFLVVIDQKRDRVSMWSTDGLDLRLGDLATSLLRGGGHSHMAGGKLGDASPSEMGSRIIGAVARYLQDQVK